MKKRIIALCLSGLLVMLFATPTLAADTRSSTDRIFKFEWTTNTRNCNTPFEMKDTSSRVYLRTQTYTLPIAGYDVKTHCQSEDPENYWSAYSYTYTINDYRSYAINHRGGTKVAGDVVRLMTTYPKDRYSTGGDVTVWWSPDYIEDGSTWLG